MNIRKKIIERTVFTVFWHFDYIYTDKETGEEVEFTRGLGVVLSKVTRLARLVAYSEYLEIGIADEMVSKIVEQVKSNNWSELANYFEQSGFIPLLNEEKNKIERIVKDIEYEANGVIPIVDWISIFKIVSHVERFKTSFLTALG